MDLVECDCCHQMIPRKNTYTDNSCNNKSDTILKKLIIAEKSRLPWNVCRTYCYTSICKNEVPKFSTLNNMKMDQVPNEISCLNSYELLLIQLAKCFHTIFRLNQISSYNKGEQAFGFKGK